MWKTSSWPPPTPLILRYWIYPPGFWKHLVLSQPNQLFSHLCNVSEVQEGGLRLCCFIPPALEMGLVDAPGQKAPDWPKGAFPAELCSFWATRWVKQTKECWWLPALSHRLIPAPALPADSGQKPWQGNWMEKIWVYFHFSWYLILTSFSLLVSLVSSYRKYLVSWEISHIFTLPWSPNSLPSPHPNLW